MIMWLLFSIFINMVSYIDSFFCIELALCPREQTLLIMLYNCFKYCWFLFADILLRAFASVFMRYIDL